MTPTTLCIAAIQMVSVNGRTAENLARAGQWVEQAVKQGAELILLSELFAIGFEINEYAWDSAEQQGGVTERWLAEMDEICHCHIGGSYLERRGDDFFNTFALAGPSGIVGRMRKRHSCSLEVYIFRGGDDAHVIAMPLGRIGAAICYDGSLCEVWDRLLNDDPDLVLMPM